jgi:hypothetical protein
MGPKTRQGSKSTIKMMSRNLKAFFEALAKSPFPKAKSGAPTIRSASL